MNHSLLTSIEALTSEKVTNITRLSGGMISDVVKIDFKNRQPLVAKLSHDSHDSHDLTIEAFMLQYLKSHSDLPIPNVVHAEEHLLLIDYIDGHIGLNQPIQSELGKMLAHLHQNTSTHYGLDRDTLAGPLHQPNPQSDSWISFFRDQRLLYMADIALKSGNLSKNIYNRLQKLAEEIDRYIIEPPTPVLIHGDMWTSNIIVNNNQVVGIIDPSIYYAHNEMELAYMTLFDTVGQSFFDSYQQIIPVEQAFFDTRQHIYGLYPLLVHVKIFGGKYVNSVDATLIKFGF